MNKNNLKYFSIAAPLLVLIVLAAACIDGMSILVPSGSADWMKE